MNEFDLDREVDVDVDVDVDREQKQNDEVHEAVIGPLSWHDFVAATLGLSRRLTYGDKNAAEDLTSDVLERLLTKADLIPATKSEAKRYVRRAMTHLFISDLRKYNSRRVVRDTVSLDVDPNDPSRPPDRLHPAASMVPVSVEALRFEARQAIEDAISQLTPALEEAVRLVWDRERGDFSGIERAEAARMSNIKRNAFDQRLSAARRDLRKLLEPFWLPTETSTEQPQGEEEL